MLTEILSTQIVNDINRRNNEFLVKYIIKNEIKSLPITKCNKDIDNINRRK